MLARLGALLVIGLGGVLAVLPRADAQGELVTSRDPKSFLLSPEPMSGEGFSAFYAFAHR